ncbi:Protein of unknown function [Gryllus bimaculatus]|nr:Protein of unknown function [Gryllus bimaculatus]
MAGATSPAASSCSTRRSSAGSSGQPLRARKPTSETPSGRRAARSRSAARPRDSSRLPAHAHALRSSFRSLVVCSWGEEMSVRSGRRSPMNPQKAPACDRCAIFSSGMVRKLATTAASAGESAPRSGSSHVSSVPDQRSPARASCSTVSSGAENLRSRAQPSEATRIFIHVRFPKPAEPMSATPCAMSPRTPHEEPLASALPQKGQRASLVRRKVAPALASQCVSSASSKPPPPGNVVYGG